MTKRVCWKKGMRLTDEILKLSDRCHLESLMQVLALSANKRFGLLPSGNDFKISIGSTKDNDTGVDLLEVTSLDCLAVVKSGEIVDISYDSMYTNNIDNRISIPKHDDGPFILCVEMTGEWMRLNDDFCEPQYVFRLIPENTPLKDNRFPLARIIKEFDLGWREDELNFVPPCLFVSCHDKFQKQVIRFKSLLDEVQKHILDCRNNSAYKIVISVFWPMVEQLRLTMDKDVELMTPMMLLGNVQKYVSAFFCGVSLNDGLELAEPQMYSNFIQTPYDYKDVYLKIKEGLEICVSINDKVSKLKDFIVTKCSVESPYISEEYLVMKCRNNKISIPIVNPTPGAKVLFSIDGSEPSKPIAKNSNLAFMADFKEKGYEDDKNKIVKIKSVLNGESSVVNTYTITLKKDLSVWEGYTI